MRISGRIVRLSICALLLALILLPGTALAQIEKPDLTLRLIPGNYDQKVIPGDENLMHLEIHNQSDAAVSNITIFPEPPKDWKVEISPSTVASLTAGAFQTVDITITPPKTASRDYYQVNFVVDYSGKREIITAYLRVDATSSVWTWIGIGLACLVIAGFVFVYRHFSRQ